MFILAVSSSSSGAGCSSMNNEIRSRSMGCGISLIRKALKWPPKPKGQFSLDVESK